MMKVVRILFGGKAQVVVGVMFVIATVYQAWYWGIHTTPSTAAIFWLSIEALFFAAYGVMATGLGFRATERVETAVVENIEEADEVNVDKGK